MAYKLTAADRRALARMRADERRTASGYRAVNYTAPKSQASGNKKEEVGFGTKVLHTVGDVGSDVVFGAAKGVEGIIDFGAGLVGAIGGLFSDDFENSIKDFIETDWVGKVADPVDSYFEHSATNGSKFGQIIEGVASGVGQMLPAVAVTVVSGGLGAPTAVAQGLSLATLGVSAAGTGAEEAFADGAGYGEGMLYGAASGATEVATERLLPGVGDEIFGKALFKGFSKVGGEVAEQGAKRVIRQTAANMLNEGVEEMASEVTNPLRKTIYKGKDAIAEYGEGEFWAGVGEAGVTGALTSAAYGATVGKVYNKVKGLNGDIDASLEKIEELAEKRDGDFADDNDSGRAHYNDSIDANYKQIEKVLTEATPEKRAKYIKNYRLGGIFNEDGTLKATRDSSTSYDKRYHSPDLDGSENIIADDISQLNEMDKTNISIYDGELSDDGKKHYTKLKKMINSLNKRGKKHISIGIVDSSAKFKGVTVDGERVYIRADVLESGDWANTPIHEVKHVGEGTKASTTLMELLEGDTSLMKKARSEVLGAEGYGFDVKNLRQILVKKNRGETLSAEEKLYYEDFSSEKGAAAVEMFLGSEEFVDKIIRLDAGLAQKLVGKWQDMKAAIKSFESKESREQYKRLVKAQKLFLEAAETAGNTDLADFIRKIVGNDDEENVDSGAAVQYNRNRDKQTHKKRSYYNQYNELVMRWAYSSSTKPGDKKMFYNGDNNTWNMLVAEDTEDKYGLLMSVEDTEQNQPIINELWSELENENNGSEQGTGESVSENFEKYWSVSGNSRSDSYDVEGQETDGRSGEVYRAESRNDGVGDSGQGSPNNGTVKKSSKIQHSYAGKKPVAADTSLFERAEAMEADGAESEAIRRETGWFKSFDGQWRYEIDDSKMRYLNPTLDAEGFTTLGELIEHEALFEAYPQLRDLKVEVKADTKYNYYSPRLKKIVLMERVFENGDFAKIVEKTQSGRATLIHEIQHAIQHIEGFARGSSPSEWRGVIRERRKKVGSGIKEHTDRTIAWLAEKYGEEIGQDTERYIELVLLDWKNKLKKSELEELDYLEVGLEMMLGEDFERIENALIAEAKWIRSIKAIAGDAELDYYNTAGEIEAYDVGDRVDLDAESRRAVRPDIDRNPDDVKFADPNSWRKMHGESGKQNKGYDFSKPFYKQVDDYINGVFPQGDSLVLGATPEHFRKIGFNALPMTINQKHVDYALNGSKNYDHEIGEIILKYLPTALKNPVAIITSKTENSTSVVAILSITHNGNQINVPVFIDGLGRQNGIRIDSNAVTSVYARKNAISTLLKDALIDEINGGFGVLYWDKKRATALLSGGKVTMPNLPNTLNDGYIHSIREKNSPVKQKLQNVTESQQFKRWFGDWQNKPKGASKVVNSDGTPRVVYHGSADFTIEEFELSEGVFGEGIYFSESKEYAESVASGGRIYECYLNIRRPYITSTQQQLDIEKLKSQGYDGIYAKEAGLWVAFDATQVKSATDNIGTFDRRTKKIQYSRKSFDNSDSNAVSGAELMRRLDIGSDLSLSNADSDARRQRNLLQAEHFPGMSDEQVVKAIRNMTRKKVYSHSDAVKVSEDIARLLIFEDDYGLLQGKGNLIEQIWTLYNASGRNVTREAALKIADSVLESAVLGNIYEVENLEPYMQTLEILRPYMHSLDLSEYREEIKHVYGNKNSLSLIWGKREGGVTPDMIADEIRGQGLSINSEAPADILFEIHELYTKSRDTIREATKRHFEDALPDDEREKLRNRLAKAVMDGYKRLGSYSAIERANNAHRAEVKRLEEDFAKEFKAMQLELTDKVRELRYKVQANDVKNSIIKAVEDIKKVKSDAFLNATKYENHIFRTSIERLSSITRANFSTTVSRQVFADLRKWYSKENPMLYKEGLTEDEQVYSQRVADMLDTICSGEGEYTITQLKCISSVIGHFKKLMQDYDKAFIDGEYVDIAPMAEKFVEINKENENIPSGMVRKLFFKYRTKFDDPMALMRLLDGYQEGYCTQLYEQLRRGVINAEVWKMQIYKRIDDFMDKHKGFKKSLSKKTVKYTVDGKSYDIPLNQAMYVYMTMKREDAILGHGRSGFEYRNKDGKYTRVEGCATDTRITDEEVSGLVEQAREGLYDKFTDAEREFISLIEQIFNEDCKNAKAKTDLERDGYTHVKEGYYVPISVSNTAHSIDGGNMFLQLNQDLGAFSFNKSTVKGQKHELRIQPLTEVFNRHLSQVAVYSNIALTADSFSRVFHFDVGGNSNKVQSVKSSIKNIWDGAEGYIKDIYAGIKGKQSDTPKWLKQLRSGYAKFALGGNLKVPITQFSSLFAAINILDIGCITAGITVKGKSDVDKYCSLAELRNYDNSAAMAQAVLDRTNSPLGKVDKIGDVLMKHIGLADRGVVKWLWGACQLQVEKNAKLKVGTEENKVEAGKLLERVLLETQQNSLLTERSAGMRGHFIYQTVTMFSADAMKVIGRVYDAFGRARFVKYRLRNAKSRNAPQAEIDKLEAELKKAHGMEARAVTALVSTSIMMYLIGLLFKLLYNKLDDEYEEGDATGIAMDAFTQTFGNMLGGLPIVRDIATKLMDGYDIDNYAYSAINDLIDGFSNLYDAVAGGDERELGNRLKNLSYAIGQITGIPVRNIYNTLYGLTKRFSPGSAYKWDNVLGKQSYSKDLQKAIEKDDEDMIETITGLILDESLGGVSDKSVRSEVSKLSASGYSVLPRSIGDKVTYDGEEIVLTKKQKARFKELYAVGNESAAELVKLHLYKKADEQAKAKALKFIYDTYYNLALQEALGLDLEEKNVLFAEAMDIEQLAIIVGIASTIEADVDRKGNVISGSRKAKLEKYVQSLPLKAAQKYMIMGYLGYKNKNGEAQVKAYINRLSLTKDERAQLLEYSGYAA